MLQESACAGGWIEVLRCCDVSAGGPARVSSLQTGSAPLGLQLMQEQGVQDSPGGPSAHRQPHSQSKPWDGS